MKHRLRLRSLAVAVAVAVIQAAWSALAAPQSAVPRSEHPRPDRVRAEWLTLNGPWSFEFDDDDRGLAERWYGGERAFSRTITVPYAFQSRLGSARPPSTTWCGIGVRHRCRRPGAASA